MGVFAVLLVVKIKAAGKGLKLDLKVRFYYSETYLVATKYLMDQSLNH